MIDFLSAKERLEMVLDRTFRGLHHCPKIHKHNVDHEFEYWEVNYYGDLATFDFDQLTRLVVAAHDNCVRASVCPSGPRMVKFRLHPRFSRDGGMCEMHPTIDQALKWMPWRSMEGES